MRDIERDVEVLLGRMAEEAGHPGPLPEGLARRATMRRGQAVLAASLAVAAAVFAGAYVTGVVQDDSRRDRLSVAMTPGRGNSADARPEEPPPQGMEGELVAQGEAAGAPWWLTAYFDGDRNLCTDFFTERDSGAVGGTGCGGFDPERHPIGVSVQSADGISSAIGHVPIEVERLELVMRDGSRSEVVEFYDAPEGLDLPLKFYVLIPFPEAEAAEWVAYDGDGVVIDRQEIFNPDHQAKTVRVTGPFVIDEGEHEGIPYVFKGHVDEQRLEDGRFWTYPCHEFLLGEGERHGGGGSCDIPLARGHELNFSQTSFETVPDIVAVHGSLQPGVDRVTVELDSGESFEARVFDVPDTNFGFFLAFPDPPRDKGLSGHVVAYRGSKEVERVEL